MDKATKALADKVTVLEKAVHILSARLEEPKVAGVILPQRRPPKIHVKDLNYKWYNSFEWWRQKWKSRPSGWWKGILEVAAIVAGIVYAFVTLCQWIDLRHQFAIEQRAWISVTHGDLGLSENAPAVVPIIYSNTGKTPARHIEMLITMKLVLTDESPVFDYRIGTFRTAKVGMLMPNDPQPIPFSSLESISPSQNAQITAGSILVMIYGKVDYDDAFGRHWVTFCSQPFRRPSGSHTAAEACAEYNNAGDK